MLIIIWFLFYIGQFLTLMYINELSQKINRNLISMSHCIFCLIFSQMIIDAVKQKTDTLIPVLWLTCSSISYFICDMFYIIINKNKNEFIYFVHHVISLCALYLMYSGINVPDIAQFFFIAESSNVLMYITYHQMKLKRQTFLLQIAQSCWYGYRRIISLGFAMPYIIMNLQYTILKFIALFMYIMGCVWSFKQFRNILFPKEKTILGKKKLAPHIAKMMSNYE